jgi:hypothetical protein
MSLRRPVFFRPEAISRLDMEIASRRTLAMTSWFDFNNTLKIGCGLNIREKSRNFKKKKQTFGHKRLPELIRQGYPKVQGTGKSPASPVPACASPAPNAGRCTAGTDAALAQAVHGNP